MQNLFKNFKSKPETIKPVWRQWLEAIIIAGSVVFVLKTFIFGTYHVPTGSAIPTILPGDRLIANKFVYRFGLSKIKHGDYVVFDDQNFKFDKSSSVNYFWQKYIGLSIPLLGLPEGPINVTKRIIACPGDWLEGRIQDGKPVIYLNHVKLEEPYLNPYPLIHLKKMSGFITPEFLGGFFSGLSFLKIKEKTAYCAYDPAKSFDQQQFFNMKPSEVIFIPNYPEATFRFPNTPTYRDAAETECADIFGPFEVPAGKYWGMGDNRKDSMDSRWFGFIDKDRIQGRVSRVLFSMDSEESFWLFELIKHPIEFFTKAVRWNRILSKPTPATEKVEILDHSSLFSKIAQDLSSQT